MSVDFVIVEADGGSRGNPGPAGYGAVVLDGATRAVLVERAEALGTETNNVAEYRGLIAGLTAARDLGARRVAVRMDSKLVVEQMSGRWQVKHPSMRPLAREAADLLASFDEVTFEWIPREKNKLADRLANEAMDRAAGKPVRSAAAPTTAPPMWSPPTDVRTRLVLVRHGSTEHSAANRFSGRNDLALDEAGRRQAAALAHRDFGKVAAVVSSPLRRAVQTAGAIAAGLGHEVEVVDDLAETDFGTWEGLTFAEARTHNPAELKAWLASPDTAPPGGESFTAVGRRVRRGREAVIAAHVGDVVVVVTHVTPIKLLLRFALDAPPSAMFRLFLDTASVSMIDYFADGNSSVRLVNDTSHLRG
ncbi:MAG TPA: bifunctional RNase H/acid phosphatase [Jatrophihabitans sp.]|jgi:probable phosphoglycerate mutase|nr:bifunctional RNase H/acid phosphatase [Jatrophihabitans sp.]